MKLAAAISIHCGGPGSGRHPEGGRKLSMEEFDSGAAKHSGGSTSADIAKMSQQIEQALGDRSTRYREALAKAPDGTKIGKFEKQTIAGDVFWTDGKKYYSGSQLLNQLGSKKVLPVAYKHYLMDDDDVKAEVGSPGDRANAPNQFEPILLHHAPSLKQNFQAYELPEESDKNEEEIMPDKAKERQKYKLERAGKSGGIQTW